MKNVFDDILIFGLEASFDGERINRNALAVREYITHADDKTLGFLEINTRQQDLLGRLEFDFIQDNDCILGIKPYCISKLFDDKRLEFRYGTEVEFAPDIVQKKLIGHELGHFMQWTSDYAPAIVGGRNILGTIIANRTVTPALGVICGMSAMAIGHAYECEALTTSVASIGSYLATGLGIGYTHRLCEKKADELSDKLVPEVTFEEAFISIGMLPKKKSASLLENIFRHAMNFSRPHPLHQTRIEKSVENCQKFLASKKINNIASLS